MPSFKISRNARQDITDILIYIAKDNPEAAISVNDRLDQLFRVLSTNPNAGRQRNELEAGLRGFPLGNYLVFYRTWAGMLTIVRVLHSARDIEEIFS